MKLLTCVSTLFVFLALSATSQVASAQSTAQINGTVRDATGLAVPGAEVKATQTATGAVRNVISGGDGAFVFANLPVGPYQVDVSKDGFSKYLQSGIVLQVDANPTIDIILKVGAVSEQVQVEADAALVETRATGVSQVIDNTRVLELPLNGRQVSDLIVLSGAAVAGGTQSSQRNYPSASISIAGGLNSSVVYLLDGGTHNDPFNNLSLPMPFPDALQEFKVETSSLSAQNGMHGAGAVNAVMKSGTNEYHGDLFEFLRNGNLNARNAFALQRDSLKRNQFGGVIGGPVKKNKLFFFLGEQTTTQRSTPVQNIAFVPTPSMLAGDWTSVTSPACNGGRQIALKAPFANNQISPALFSPPAVNLVHLKNWPTSTDPCGAVHFGNVANNNEAIIDSRVDYSMTAKQSLFTHYQFARLDNPTDYDGVNFLSISQPVYKRRAQDAVVGDTYLIGSATVSSFRVTFFRTLAEKNTPPTVTFNDLGVQGWYTYPDAPPGALIGVAGAFNLGGSTAVNKGVQNSTGYQFAEDLSMVKGAHQFGFGVNFIHSGMNDLSNQATPGNFQFTATNTGMGLGDFMLGNVNSFNQMGDIPFYFRQNYIGMYAQDTWKLNSHLTVSAGVRWEPYWSPWEKFGHVFHFDLPSYVANVHSTVFPNAPAGVQYPGDPGVPNDHSFFATRWKQFAPRMGIAWDPKGDGRMTIRGAYGIFRDFPQMFIYSQIVANPPWDGVVSVSQPPGGFLNPWQGYPGGSPYPYTVNSSSGWANAQQVVEIPEHQQQPYMQQWNLSVQKQFGADWLVAANYLGNNVTHVLSSAEHNPATYLPGPSCVINGRSFSPCSATSNTTQRRYLTLLNPSQGQFFGPLILADDGGTRHYEGLILSVQRRRSKGVTVQGNYTWSHCISTTTQVSFSGPAYDTLDRRAANRGNCDSDRRHNLNASVVYETPRFSNRAVRLAGSGWQVGGILQILSGPYFTVGSGLDNALTAVTTTVGERPNQILPSIYKENGGNQYLNPAAFAQPATGTYGNMGAANVLGKGQVILNTSLVRKFQIREAQSIEFRAESFNIANHVNPCPQGTAYANASACPVLGLTSSTFGQILFAGDPRINQLALKFVF